MIPPTPVIYQFADFQVDEERFELRRASGEVVPISPRALELLLLLLRNRGVVVDKETIRREVWGGLTVSRSALPTQVLKLRKILEDTDGSSSLIQTVPRKGLRFVGEVTQVGAHQPVVLQPTEPPEALDSRVLSSHLVGDRPTIAVLPFSNPTEDRGPDGLARAMPMDIIVALSRLNDLRVIAHSSALAFGQTPFSPSAARNSLAVDYCLSGEIFSVRDTRELFVELVDAKTEGIVWAKQFEFKPVDVHATKEDIVRDIVRTTELAIPNHEAHRALIKQPASLTAWEAYYAGVALSNRRGVSNAQRARLYFERAVSIDPTFARAQAELAVTYTVEAINEASGDNKHATRQMLKHAERAIENDPQDPSALVAYGWSRQYSGGGASQTHWYEAALEASPNYVRAHNYLAAQLGAEGKSDDSASHCKAAIRLDPLSPYRFNNYAILAVAKMRMGKGEEALHWGCKAGDAPFDEVQPLITSIMSYHLRGDKKRAEQLAKRYKAAFADVPWSGFFGSHLIGSDHSSMLKVIASKYGI